jgi:hypothetical protein
MLHSVAWFGLVFHWLFIGFFVIENALINITTQVIMAKHSPTAYLSDKKRFIQIHAANLEILKE